MKIGVAIPTYGNDVILINRCLRSIENQTKLPSIVVISASSCKKENIFIDNYPFRVQLLSTEDPQNASTNRNKAANWIIENETVDIISFFDSDDEMCFNRLEYIEKALSETNYDFVVHNYKMVRSSNESINMENNECRYFTNCFIPLPNCCGIYVVPQACHNLFPHLTTDLAHGNVSVTTNVWKNDKFREENEYVLWEDSEYGNRLNTKYRGVYIQNILLKYHNYNETINDYHHMIVYCESQNYSEEAKILLAHVTKMEKLSL